MGKCKVHLSVKVGMEEKTEPLVGEPGSVPTINQDKVSNISSHSLHYLLDDTISISVL